jgi:hypothetical protein
MKRYIPVGALIGRYENAARLVLQDSPQSDKNKFNILMDGQVYTDPTCVAWFYEVEPPKANFFILIGQKDEDQFGNVTSSSSGDTIIIQNGVPYLKNATTGLYNAIRSNGVDGAVSIEISQVGVAL